MGVTFDLFNAFGNTRFYLRNLRQDFRFKLNGWTLPAIFLGLLICLPISEILLNLTTPAENWEHLRETVLGRYLQGSLILVIGTAVLSILFGVSSAWLVSCCEFPGRKVFEWALILPLAIPPFVAAYAYFDLLDNMTPLLVWVRLNVSPSAMITLSDTIVYPVTILVLSSVLYPYVYLMTRAAFSMQGTQFIEAARTLGHGPVYVFWRVALPMARPAIVAGVSLVVMETLNDYGAVKHFGVPTFTTGIFRTWLSLNDMPGALRLAACLMVLVFFFLFLEKCLRFRAKFHVNKQAGRTLRRYSLGKVASFAAIVCCLLPLLAGFLVPVSRMSWWASLTFEKVLDSSFFGLILNSTGIAAIAGLITMTIALFLAFSARYFNCRKLSFTNRLAILGYSVPGAVIAMGVLLLTGHFRDFGGWVLTGSLVTLTFAYLVRFLAVAWQSIDSGMERNCDQLNDASKTLGASPGVSLRMVNVPLLRNSMLAAGLFVFVDTMKELPLTLILRPFNFETLSTRAFDLTSQAQIPESSLPSLCIILVVLLPVICLNRQMRVRPK